MAKKRFVVLIWAQWVQKKGCQMKVMILTAAAVSFVAAPVLAQTGDLTAPDSVYQITVESGVCEDRDVRTAVFNAAENVIEVTCEEEAAGFVPLLGGLGGGGMALALGGVALALGGLGSTPDSQ